MHVFSSLRIRMLTILCAGCAGGPPDGAVDSAASGTPPTKSDTVTTLAPESLHVRLEVPSEARIGEPVPIVIRLENRGDRPLDLSLRGRTIAFDIFITRRDGQLIWQRLKDEIIPGIIQLKVLRPGEVFELKDEWRQRGNHGEPIGPGGYSVRGTVLTDGAALETALASLRIVPS